MTDHAAAALAILNQRFGYPAFRAGQAQAVASVMAGNETVVILPTGGGKSLCYQVPALLLPGLTLVVSPLISLMKDQVDALDRRGIPAAFINSSLTPGQVSDRLARAMSGDLKLLYVAPERFSAGATLDRLRDARVSLFAVDEAHCISEWGHDFRPSYLRLAAVRERLGHPTIIALTATATPHVREDIVRQLDMGRPRTIVTGFDRTNLTYHVRSCRTDADKDRALVEELKAREGVAIVYASTRKAVERIAGMLTRKRIPALPYHAGLDDAHRHDVQEAFMGERARVIVATNAFGMGIDKPNVRLVVHHAMPGTLEAYYQEAGRAGRDGRPAECVLLHAFRDRFTHEYFIKSAHPRRDVTERLYDLIRRGGPRVAALDAAALAKKLGTGTNARDVEAALRLLERAGAWRPPSPAGRRVHVRLLATPERIRTELGADRALELGLLRSLWRLGRDRLYDGITLDLDGLPPALGGPQALDMLDRLQGQQIVEWTRLEAGSTLARPAATLDAFRIDWASLERRRKADLDKLETMQRYSYTERCRRAFVLRYFGDPSERPECGACDNCLGRSERRPARPRAAAGHKPRYIGTDDVLVAVPSESESQRASRRRRDADTS
ncbi:MAG: RecQ family ATP-dependent DNA helicase [Gemmatimonadota bacterium]|nr:RecQ family ATP-dependent DNA helicase [Gemmatimonadota bacterium]